MIDGYFQRGHSAEAIALFGRMRLLVVKLGGCSLSIVLGVCDMNVLVMLKQSKSVVTYVDGAKSRISRSVASIIPLNFEKKLELYVLKIFGKSPKYGRIWQAAPLRCDQDEFSK